MCRVTDPNQHSTPTKTNLHVMLERNFVHKIVYICTMNRSPYYQAALLSSFAKSRHGKINLHHQRHLQTIDIADANPT